MPNSDKIQQSGSPAKVGVFISYNHVDRPIADALRQALIAISSELDTFIDHVGLDPGDDYEDKLAKSISASQWFLMICSGPLSVEKNMAWSFYEAGQFRMKLLADQGKELIRSRFVAIHDDDIPSELSKFHAVKISATNPQGHPLPLKTDGAEMSLFDTTPIFSFFVTIITKSRVTALRDVSDENVRTLLRTQAQLVIRAFSEMQIGGKLPERVFQPRISFFLPPTTNNVAAKLSPDTNVIGDEPSLSTIFGIAATETTWGTIKARCKEEDGNDPLWVGEIEAAVEQVSLGYVPNQPDGLCSAKGGEKFYEVLFARYQPFRSGARICYIVFIPRRSRKFDVRHRTSILLSALILSIRFRQRILPYITRIHDLTRSQKVDGLLQLETELHEIETEAKEFGLAMPKHEDDDPPLVRQFRDGDNKLFVEQSIRSWQTSRSALTAAFTSARVPDPNVGRLEAGAQGADVAVNELQKFQDVNERFIQVLIEELLFVEKVGSVAGAT
jgi:TIR domain